MAVNKSTLEQKTIEQKSIEHIARHAIFEYEPGRFENFDPAQIAPLLSAAYPLTAGECEKELYATEWRVFYTGLERHFKDAINWGLGKKKSFPNLRSSGVILGEKELYENMFGSNGIHYLNVLNRMAYQYLKGDHREIMGRRNLSERGDTFITSLPSEMIVAARTLCEIVYAPNGSLKQIDEEKYFAIVSSMRTLLDLGYEHLSKNLKGNF